MPFNKTIKENKRNLIITLLGSTLLAGCATKDNVQIDKSKSLSENLESLERAHKEAQLSHAEILAPITYKDGSELLASVKDELQEDDPDYGEILEDMEDGLKSLSMADEIADERYKEHKSLVSRRHMVLNEGIKKEKFKYLKNRFDRIDNDLKSELADRDGSMDQSRAEIYEARYKNIHAEVVKRKKLHKVTDLLRTFRKLDLDKQMPTTYDSVSDQLDKTISLIEEKPEDESHYKKAYNTTIVKAIKAAEVGQIIRTVKGPTTEQSALVIWKQRNKISELKGDKNDLKWSLGVASGLMNALVDSNVKNQNQVESLRRKVSAKVLADELRNNFDEDKVVIMEKGNKVIVSFKEIPYAINQSKVPSSSKEDIKKVVKIVKKTTPDKVIVRGHADTIGTQKQNKIVSQKRAKVVKEMVKNMMPETEVSAKSLSYSKPMKPNLNSTNREINRRIDLVIIN